MVEAAVACEVPESPSSSSRKEPNAPPSRQPHLLGSRQLKKGAVTPAKLSKATLSTLIGPKGSTGATGPQGPEGDGGPSRIVRAFHAGNPIRRRRN
jgi:hypothetical protein